ncbi:GCN5 family acetyltransferase [Bordetella sp. H567]|nr:GNAT family N-acetyltransferase [Bordetella sp. H567]AOB33077.1 GCN5 family acetyltransferase [Bordetella sp. H567]
MSATTPYIIRPATPQDVPGILALMRELAEYEKLTAIFAATEDSLRASLFGRTPAAECMVAQRTDGGQAALLAYAVWFHNYSTFLCRRGLYLEDVYVRADQRGQGVGRALLRQLAAIAVERGCGRFEWTVLDWNQPAIDFYESLGAEVLPEWRIVRVTGAALDKMGRASLPAKAEAGQHG